MSLTLSEAQLAALKAQLDNTDAALQAIRGIITNTPLSSYAPKAGDRPQVQAIESAPTEKQLSFLAKLGVHDFKGTRMEASTLIDQKVTEKGWKK